MANFSVIKYLLKLITAKKKDLRNVTSKIHKTVGSIGFIKKALYHKIKPISAQVQSDFINNNNKNKGDKSILLPHFNDHVCSFKKLCKKYNSLCIEHKQLTGKFLYLVKTYFISLVVQKQVCL